jgi:hypothetical protein
MLTPSIFHLLANARKMRNFIHTLQLDDGVASLQQEKQQAIYDHFLQQADTYVPRQCALNFIELGWLPRNLDHLDLPFSEEEIKTVIMEAPGPDGFISKFYSACWNILKDDLISAIQQFYLLNQLDLLFLDQDFMVLVPKKSLLE